LPEPRITVDELEVQLVTDPKAIAAADVAAVFAHGGWTRERSLEAIQRMLENTEFAVLARTATGPVGFARLVTDRTFRAFVEDVVVVQRARGRGVGKAMMLWLEDVARRLGVPRLDLTTQEAAFWAKLGFELKPASKCMVKRLTMQRAAPE